MAFLFHCHFIFHLNSTGGPVIIFFSSSSSSSRFSIIDIGLLTTVVDEKFFMPRQSDTIFVRILAKARLPNGEIVEIMDIQVHVEFGSFIFICLCRLKRRLMGAARVSFKTIKH